MFAIAYIRFKIQRNGLSWALSCGFIACPYFTINIRKGAEEQAILNLTSRIAMSIVPQFEANRGGYFRGWPDLRNIESILEFAFYTYCSASKIPLKE